MPLYKSIAVNANTQLLVWQITETLDELARGVDLKQVCVSKMDKMKSEQHRKGFLSVRQLMREVGYTDFDLFYDADGKPHLKDGKNISITHSYSFSAIIVSDQNIGIDMELQREKVITIADKFVDPEFAYLDPTHLEEYMRKLIVIWGVKEAIYKMISRSGLSFKQNITVLPFDMQAATGVAAVKFEEIDAVFDFYFEEIEGFTLVYSLDNTK